MKAPPDTLFAWTHEGEDSFIAVLIENVWYPMVFCDEGRAMKMQPLVLDVVKKTGKPAALRSYKFDKIVGGIA